MAVADVWLSYGQSDLINLLKERAERIREQGYDGNDVQITNLKIYHELKKEIAEEEHTWPNEAYIILENEYSVQLLIENPAIKFVKDFDKQS